MARREPCILPTVDTTVKALPDGRCLGGKSSAAYHAHDRTRVSRGQTPSEQSSDVMDIIKCRSEAQRIRTAKDRLMTGLMVRSSFKAGRETGPPNAVACSDSSTCRSQQWVILMTGARMCSLDHTKRQDNVDMPRASLEGW